MKNFKLDILLEHLQFKCKYYATGKKENFCERAWVDTDRIALKSICCKGQILECELTSSDVMRNAG